MSMDELEKEILERGIDAWRHADGYFVDTREPHIRYMGLCSKCGDLIIECGSFKKKEHAHGQCPEDD